MNYQLIELSTLDFTADYLLERRGGMSPTIITAALWRGDASIIQEICETRWPSFKWTLIPVTELK